MTIALNDPVKQNRDSLSHRQRFRLYRDEIAYCLARVINELIKLHRETGENRLFLGLTTQDKERQLFQLRLQTDGLYFIIIAAGRIAKFDSDSPAQRRVCVILETNRFTEPVQMKLHDLLEVYCVLADSWHMATALKGEHAKRVRHTKVTEKEMSQAMKFATERCDNAQL